MADLIKRWQQWSDLFDARSLRERILIAVGIAAVAVLLMDALLLGPLEIQQKRLSAQLSEARTAIKAGEMLITASNGTDPDEVKRRYRDELRKQIADIDDKLQGLQKQLVPPDQVAKLLEGVLKKERGLTLVSLRKLPVQRYQTGGAAQPAPGVTTQQPAAGSEAANGTTDRSIYQHSFEVSIEGSYAELHGYLSRLEALPWQLFWGKVTLDAAEHPRLRLTLTLHTLSLNKAWLVV